VGWSYESFVVARHIKPSLRASDFSLDTFAENLFDNFPDVDRINLALAQQRGAEEAELSFFLYLDQVTQVIGFRKALGKISLAHARLVLLFLFSGLRWRISRVSLKTCPFCPRFDLLWSHFFECETMQPYLIAEFISRELLLYYVRRGRWRDVFALIGFVVGVWCDHLSTCALDVDVVWSLAYLP
jgi:hypothetical protein